MAHCLIVFYLVLVHRPHNPDLVARDADIIGMGVELWRGGAVEFMGLDDFCCTLFV